MPQLQSSYCKRYGLNCRGFSTPLPHYIMIIVPLVSNPALLGRFLWPSVSGPFLDNPIRSRDVISHTFYSSFPFIFKIKINKKQKNSCLFWLFGDLILIPSQFNSVAFVLFLYACTAVPLHPTTRFDSLGDVVSLSHLPSASTGHVGCCVTCSLCHHEV